MFRVLCVRFASPGWPVLGRPLDLAYTNGKLTVRLPVPTAYTIVIVDY